MKFLDMLQDNDVDPFGFGLRYEATGQHSTSKWKDLYTIVTFDVSVDVNVKSIGSIE